MTLANRYDTDTTTKMLITEGIEDYEHETEDRLDAELVLDYINDALDDACVTSDERTRLLAQRDHIETMLTS